MEKGRKREGKEEGREGREGKGEGLTKQTRFNTLSLVRLIACNNISQRTEGDMNVWSVYIVLRSMAK